MILSRYLGPCFTLHHSTILLYCLQHLHNCHYKTVTHEMAAVQMQCQPQRLEQNLSLSHKETGTKFCDDRTTGWDFPPQLQQNQVQSTDSEMHENRSPWRTAVAPFAFESKEKSSVAFQRWWSLAASANMDFNRTMKVHSVPYLTHICGTASTLLNRFDDPGWL